MVATAEQAHRQQPRGMGSRRADTGVGTDMGVGWLQVMGLCPYVVVGPEGACRVGWLPAAWCVVRLALLVTLQVAEGVLEEALRNAHGISRESILNDIGKDFAEKGSHVASSCSCLLLLLLSPRLVRLVREVAALQRLAGSLNSAGPQRMEATSVVLLWVSVVVYLFCSFRFLGLATSGSWFAVALLALGEWLLSFPSLLSVVLLFSRELRRLQAATRAVLPPHWEQVVVEAQDKTTGVHCSTHWCGPTTSLVPFMRRSRLVLLQTEEVLACLLAYLGGPLFMWLSCSVVFFTLGTYFLLLSLMRYGQFDCYVFLMMLFLGLVLLTINIAAENLVQERHRCARVYRRLLAHPDVAQLPEAAEVLTELERPVQIRIMKLFNLGGSCITTTSSLILSYLVIALQVGASE